MFRSSDHLFAFWATLLFTSFVYIAKIVLISLLIVILADTYERVRSKEKAELRKLRLRIGANSYIRPALFAISKKARCVSEKGAKSEALFGGGAAGRVLNPIFGFCLAAAVRHSRRNRRMWIVIQPR